MMAQSWAESTWEITNYEKFYDDIIVAVDDFFWPMGCKH